jgi:hypothetical protein
MAELKFKPGNDKNTISFKVVGVLQTLEVGKTTFSAKAGSINKVVIACGPQTKGECSVTITPVEVSSGLAIGKVRYKDKNVEKEGKVDIVESEVGGESTYSKTRTIRREITYSVKIGLSAEAEAKLGASLLAARAELTNKIKLAVETELGEKWTEEITETATHKINLDKYPRVKVIWLDVYRTGTVDVTQEGKTCSVPFEFPVATRTVLKAVK